MTLTNLSLVTISSSWFTPAQQHDVAETFPSIRIVPHNLQGNKYHIKTMTISLTTIEHLRSYIKHSTQSFIRYPDTMMTGSCALFSTHFSDFLMSGCLIKNCESCLTHSIASRWLDIGWNTFCRVCSNDIFSRCLDIKWNTPSGIWYITSQW